MNAMQFAIACHFQFDNVDEITDDLVYSAEENEAIGEYVRRYRGTDAFLISVRDSTYGLSVKQRRVVVRKIVTNFREYMANVDGAIVIDDDGEFALESSHSVKPNVAQTPVQQLPNATPHTANIRTSDTALETQLQAGIYTVELPGKHVTLKILPVKEKPGITHVVSVLTGPDNWSEYTGFAWLKEGNRASIWQKASHLTHAATALQQMLDGGASLQAAHCNACGRLLTVPASLYAGFGPECRKKNGG
jgi:hypothetical protein